MYYNELSRIYSSLNEYGKALESADKCIKLNPTGRGYKNGGYALENLERYKEAEEYYLKAVELNSDDPLCYAHLGYLYFAFLKDKEKALTTLKKTKELWESYHKDNYIYTYPEFIEQNIASIFQIELELESEKEEKEKK